MMMATKSFRSFSILFHHFASINLCIKQIFQDVWLSIPHYCETGWWSNTMLLRIEIAVIVESAELFIHHDSDFIPFHLWLSSISINWSHQCPWLRAQIALYEMHWLWNYSFLVHYRCLILNLNLSECFVEWLSLVAHVLLLLLIADWEFKTLLFMASFNSVVNLIVMILIVQKGNFGFHFCELHF